MLFLPKLLYSISVLKSRNTIASVLIAFYNFSQFLLDIKVSQIHELFIDKFCDTSYVKFVTVVQKISFC